DVDGGLHLREPPAGGDELVRAAGADLHELLADQPLRLHRDDGVRLDRHPVVDLHRHSSLEILEADGIDPADPDPGDLPRRSALEPTDSRKVGVHRVAPGPEEVDLPEPDRQVGQGENADQHEEPDSDLDLAAHAWPSTSYRTSVSISPWMNCRTAGSGEL